jgi:hypothetical protein
VFLHSKALIEARVNHLCLLGNQNWKLIFCRFSSSNMLCLERTQNEHVDSVCLLLDSSLIMINRIVSITQN